MPSDRKIALKLGSIAGTIALLCCISPIVLVFLGLSSVSAALALGQLLYDDYKWVFISASGLFLVSALTYVLKKRDQCSLSEVRRNVNLILLTMVISVMVYIFWFVLTSWIETLA